MATETYLLKGVCAEKHELSAQNETNDASSPPGNVGLCAVVKTDFCFLAAVEARSPRGSETDLVFSPRVNGGSNCDSLKVTDFSFSPREKRGPCAAVKQRPRFHKASKQSLFYCRAETALPQGE